MTDSLEPSGADTMGAASDDVTDESLVDETPVSRRRFQYSLRTLLLLAAAVSGLFWAFRILLQSGREDKLALMVPKLAIGGIVVAIVVLPLILLAHALLYLVARLLANQLAPSESSAADSSQPSSPAVTKPASQTDTTLEESTDGHPSSPGT